MSFAKRDVTAMDPEVTDSGNKIIEVSICSDDGRKLSWMQEKRRLFMHINHEACWDESTWLLRYHDCTFNNIPEDYCPPMP